MLIGGGSGTEATGIANTDSIGDVDFERSSILSELEPFEQPVLLKCNLAHMQGTTGHS